MENLSCEKILSFLSPENKGVGVCVLDVVDSTNTYIKNVSVEILQNAYVVAANEQTSGRGRRGNSFFSPRGAGVYFSIYLKCDTPISSAVNITTAVALAVSKAIEKVTGVLAGIKWVNDLYIGDKKLCGILTESVISTSSSRVDGVIIGIGINVSRPEGEYPESIRDIVTNLESASEKEFSKNHLVAEIVNETISVWRDICGGECTFIDEYKKRSIVLGKQITYTTHLESGESIEKTGVAMDIDKDGGLVVSSEEGEVITLNSGVISVKVW